MKKIIDKLFCTLDADDVELKELIESSGYDNYLYEQAECIRKKYYGTDVYIRGLIEISNYCKNNCYYCGIRASNINADRYRLSKDDILSCCKSGYQLGFRTFVMQGGEDNYFTDEIICDIVSSIKSMYPDCAVTLSLGEKSYESYLAYYNAGADRYLLRHETANDDHYRKLHPENLHPENRKKCLFDLNRIGYQTGSGFMVGSPFQTTENLIEDIRFLQELQPAMIGIGPFISHKDTPFKQYTNGSLELCLKMLSILRLMFPTVLLPATTALGTISDNGRELGIKAGANVVMPNLSPVKYRKLYEIYDNKICTGEEAAECKFCLQKRMSSIGYNIVVSRGDFIKTTTTNFN